MLVQLRAVFKGTSHALSAGNARTGAKGAAGTVAVYSVSDATGILNSGMDIIPSGGVLVATLDMSWVPDGTPSVGEPVEMPVRVGAYLSHGMAVARLSWGADDTGSDF